MEAEAESVEEVVAVVVVEVVEEALEVDRIVVEAADLVAEVLLANWKAMTYMFVSLTIQ